MIKKLHLIFTLLSVLCFTNSLLTAQELGFEPYYSTNSLFGTSAGALGTGLLGWENPALLSYNNGFNMMYSWQTLQNNPFNLVVKNGFQIGLGGFSYGKISNKFSNLVSHEHRISLGAGNKSSAVGIGWGWASGDTIFSNPSSVLTFGTLTRSEFLSVGLSGTWGYDFGTTEGVMDVGIRPFKNNFLTLFSDYAVHTGQKLFAGNWSAGLVLEPFAGIRLTGRYYDNKNMSVGLQLISSGAALAGNLTLPSDKNLATIKTYSLKAGIDRNPFARGKGGNYMYLNMLGGMAYQRFQLFDDSKTLLGTLQNIRDAKEDESVSGIYLNISGMNIGKEMLWELREALKEFKSSGKKIVIYFDRIGIDDYHFASVADKILIDPMGSLTLEGYVAGRTFLKGGLDKLGVGVDELRFFKYKSAFEGFSRDKFSEADKEQRQDLINDYYKLAQIEICTARKIDAAKFDEVVNGEFMLSPEAALKQGFVDNIARYDAVDSIIKQLEGEEKILISPNDLTKYSKAEDLQWGEKPKVAVIYALGACAMDEGINARSLAQYCQQAVDNASVKAIVLRVDSPGGDALASDLVAEVLLKAKGRKPVIVSQGSVAASGGYWLSMYSDTIVAAPNTITGSIGVISGWFYNKEAKDKLGITTDLVKAGKHSDLGFGMVLPIVGIGLPDRAFTTEERAVMETNIKDMYKDFVSKVAKGRKKKFEEIEPLAQGHVYSGTQGLKIGLVDVLGGLQTAIDIASKKAGLDKNEYNVVTMPPPPLVNTSSFMPSLIGVDLRQATQDPTFNMLKFRLKNNGKALPLVPLDTEFDLINMGK